MITASVESFMERLDELEPLFFPHWEKLALNRDRVPLAPAYDAYEARERAGELLFIALRDAGRLIGYWVSFVGPGMHYRTSLTATMDMWNVLPEYENGVASLILMRAVEREYRRRGVVRAFAGEKLHRPCGRLYRAFDYEPIETYYGKLIGDR